METRTQIIDRFRAQAAAGTPIIGGGAGTGITAKSAEAGGIDLLVIYNSGRFRMAGRGSLSGLLAYGDANTIVLDMADEVLPVVGSTPVIAGVNGTDPFKVMPHFLERIKAIGFAGVQNFPTVGLIDLLTTPYVFDIDQAEAMALAGADILVPHMGLTTSGTIGAQTAMSLDEAAEKVQSLVDAAKRVNPEILCLCHGGPIAGPEDAQYILDHTEGVVGFYGASSIERFPTETGIRQQTEAFKALRFER